MWRLMFKQTFCDTLQNKYINKWTSKDFYKTLIIKICHNMCRGDLKSNQLFNIKYYDNSSVNFGLLFKI